MSKEAHPPKDASDPKFYDVRTISRNLKRGLITRKDYEKHLKTIPDSKDKVLPQREA